MTGRPRAAGYPHRCNFHCKGDRHADIYYAMEPGDPEHIRGLVADMGYRVVEMREAPEAPERGPDGKPWLFRYLIVVEP